MTSKERILTALKAEEPDRIPFSPFLAYYWDYLPVSIQDKGQVAYLKSIGADPLLRGFHKLYKLIRRGTNITESVTGNVKQVSYETKVGTLRETYLYVKEANTWYLNEHPVKTEEDLKILTYIYENTIVESNMDQFIIDNNELGDGGLYLPLIGTDSKSCFQAMIEHWVGTEELVYALCDYPDTVKACLYTMKKPALKTVKMSVDSPAEGFIFWEDSSTTNISPDFFAEYISPELASWAEIIHDSGKLLGHHACGHLRALIPHMAKTGIDSIESVTPPPTGDIEPWEIREMIPDDISLIGGIDPVFLLDCTIEELDHYVGRLIRKMGNRGFILANADSCPPGVTEEKFRKIPELIDRYSEKR